MCFTHLLFFPKFGVAAFNGGLVTLCMEREGGVVWGPHYVIQLPSLENTSSSLKQCSRERWQAHG